MDIALNNTFKNTDTMGNMNHIISNIQVRDILNVDALFLFWRLCLACSGFGMA